MASVNIYQAKTQFSKLVKRVRAGEEITIADAGMPVAKLVPFELPKTRRVLGGDRISIAPDAFDPMTEDELALWYESPLFPKSRAKAPARRAVKRPPAGPRRAPRR